MHKGIAVIGLSVASACELRCGEWSGKTEAEWLNDKKLA